MKTSEKSKNYRVAENTKNAQFFFMRGHAGPEAPCRGRATALGHGIAIANAVKGAGNLAMRSLPAARALGRVAMAALPAIL